MNIDHDTMNINNTGDDYVDDDFGNELLNIKSASLSKK